MTSPESRHPGSKLFRITISRQLSSVPTASSKRLVRGCRGTITTPCRCRQSNRRPAHLCGIRCYSRLTVRFHDAPESRRHAVAASLIALIVLVAGTGWALTAQSPLAHHGPHVPSSSVVGDFAAAVEHSHAQNEPARMAADAFTSAALPRSVTQLVIFGLLAVVGAAFAWRSTNASLDIRGPPIRGQHLTAGQQLLVRLCIARR